jgi:hypothetical protein
MRSESSSVCCCPGDFSRYSHRYPLVVNVCASSTGEREYQAAFLLASHGSTSLVARVERVVFLYALFAFSRLVRFSRNPSFRRGFPLPWSSIGCLYHFSITERGPDITEASTSVQRALSWNTLAGSAASRSSSPSAGTRANPSF